MSAPTRTPSPYALAAFLLASVIGGANFLAVRLSNRELEPFWGASLRFGLAAALFLAAALALRLPRPRGREFGLTVLYGALGFAVSYALMYWALVRVTAGVAVVVFAVVPLATLILASAQGLEQLRLRGIAGAFLALAGIASFTVSPGEVELPLPALLAMLGATLSAAQAMIIGKRLADNHPVMTNAIAMTVGAVLLLACSAAAGESWVLPQENAARWAVGYLALPGSAGLFVLILFVSRHWTASASSYMTVLFPVVTIALGAWIVDEPITTAALVGAGLVIVGVWIGALSPAARRPQLLRPADTERAVTQPNDVAKSES
ncbi:MAG TPA: DMT family transporter [Acidimicrobiales bacterium]|nr:DMT family transporter [Acidimicrobiales bacterium]